jgi:hypothetical protein
MSGVPRSPYEDGKYQTEGSDDNGERPAAHRAFPILTILHATLPSDVDRERGCPRDGSRPQRQPAGRTAAIFLDLPSLKRSSQVNATADKKGRLWINRIVANRSASSTR